MKTIIKNQPTKRAIKLLDFALKNKASFTTGTTKEGGKVWRLRQQ